MEDMFQDMSGNYIGSVFCLDPLWTHSPDGTPSRDYLAITRKPVGLLNSMDSFMQHSAEEYSKMNAFDKLRFVNDYKTYLRSIEGALRPSVLKAYLESFKAFSTYKYMVKGGVAMDQLRLRPDYDLINFIVHRVSSSSYSTSEYPLPMYGDGYINHHGKEDIAIEKLGMNDLKYDGKLMQKIALYKMFGIKAMFVCSQDNLLHYRALFYEHGCGFELMSYEQFEKDDRISQTIGNQVKSNLMQNMGDISGFSGAETLLQYFDYYKFRRVNEDGTYPTLKECIVENSITTPLINSLNPIIWGQTYKDIWMDVGQVESSDSYTLNDAGFENWQGDFLFQLDPNIDMTIPSRISSKWGTEATSLLLSGISPNILAEDMLEFNSMSFTGLGSYYGSSVNTWESHFELMDAIYPYRNGKFTYANKNSGQVLITDPATGRYYADSTGNPIRYNSYTPVWNNKQFTLKNMEFSKAIEKMLTDGDVNQFHVDAFLRFVKSSNGNDFTLQYLIEQLQGQGGRLMGISKYNRINENGDWVVVLPDSYENLLFYIQAFNGLVASDAVFVGSEHDLIQDHDPNIDTLINDGLVGDTDTLNQIFPADGSEGEMVAFVTLTDAEIQTEVHQVTVPYENIDDGSSINQNTISAFEINHPTNYVVIDGKLGEIIWEEIAGGWVISAIQIIN